MKLPETKDINDDVLMLWIMHRFADEFQEHAILKGGMQLMLLSSERHTNDLDYVFVPYNSKKDLLPKIEEILSEIPDAQIKKTLHSNSGRYEIALGRGNIQIEFNVATEMPSTSLTTSLLAAKVGSMARVIRVMSSEVAFAHKLAAWNERRLVRDLYDIFYWHSIVKVFPEIEVLKKRLEKINSRLPSLRTVKKMSLAEFLGELSKVVAELTEERFLAQLRGLMEEERLKGLLPVVKTKINELISRMQRAET